jgi:hypothetical protein
LPNRDEGSSRCNQNGCIRAGGRFEDRDGGSLVEVRVRPVDGREHDATDYDYAALACWRAYGGSDASLNLKADLGEDGEATYRAK